jgi:hypothetical protein
MSNAGYVLIFHQISKSTLIVSRNGMISNEDLYAATDVVASAHNDNPIERYNSVWPASWRLLAMTAGSKNEAAFDQEHNDSPEQIREAVREVIGNPSYRERAKTLGTSIRKTNALKTIAEVIEAEVSYQRRRDQVGY